MWAVWFISMDERLHIWPFRRKPMIRVSASPFVLAVVILRRGMMHETNDDV